MKAMGSERPADIPVDERKERITRLRAMFARWEAEAVAEDEPDWAVEELAPLRIGTDSRDSDA